jgi:diaminopimelate epimerase
VDYFKLSGSGNDFLALAEPAQAPSAEAIRAWCRRGVSLGADGLFVLRREGAAVRMDYFNADGLPADLCLNGTRCAARLAFALGWAAERVAIATPAGAVAARRAAAERVAVELAAPGEPRAVEALVAGEVHRGWAVAPGVPHLVLLWPTGLAEAPVATLGPALRRHPAVGPAGANVNFVRLVDPRGTGGGPSRMEIRTYERGVEAETLSCGTGVLAGAAVGVARGLASFPVVALTASGFALEVDATPRDRPFSPDARWTLTGDARLLARGTLTPEAATGPAPPAWSP